MCSLKVPPGMVMVRYLLRVCGGKWGIMWDWMDFGFMEIWLGNCLGFWLWLGFWALNLGQILETIAWLGFALVLTMWWKTMWKC